jgi:subtilisin family serine protease
MPPHTYPGITIPPGNDRTPTIPETPAEPEMPASNTDPVIPEPGTDVPQAPPLPDDPSIIEPELETDYLTAPVNKERTPRIVVSGEATYVPGQVLVLLSGASGNESAIDVLAEKYNLNPSASSALGSIGATMVLFTIPDGRSVVDLSNTLSSEPSVLVSQPNFYYDSLSDGSIQYGVRKIRADAVHGVTTGRGITVAVLDTGVDFNHPALKDKIILKTDFVNPDMSGFTSDGHGTSVAGIIAAAGQGDEPMGVAPGVGIIAVKACWPDQKNGRKAVCSSDKLARGLDFAILNRAQIINFSLGGPKDGIIAELISRANGSGIVVVAAGGNGGSDGKPVYPAALPTVIAVSATDSQDGLYAMSTPGKYIDVAAPGVDILSPAPGGSWQMVSGTSMAAAHVSAAVALILQNYPELSPFQVKYLLESRSVDLGEAGRDDKFGEGRIDVFEAIDELNDSAEARAQ